MVTSVPLDVKSAAELTNAVENRFSAPAGNASINFEAEGARSSVVGAAVEGAAAIPTIFFHLPDNFLAAFKCDSHMHTCTAPGEALHAMALRHPPLAAPAAVLRSAPGSREAWWRSCASDWRTGGEPWGANVQNMLRSTRCVRLSVLAVPAAVRLRLGLSRYKARAS